jgi:hypothetical protein
MQLEYVVQAEQIKGAYNINSKTFFGGSLLEGQQDTFHDPVFYV